MYVIYISSLEVVVQKRKRGVRKKGERNKGGSKK